MANVLLVCDRSAWSRRARALISRQFGDIDVVEWEFEPGRRPSIEIAPRDWIFSFKSDIVLPSAVLSSARIAAVNFHPAPPRYRGIGGYHYAVANGDDTFGVTCHLMDQRIDHGPILRVRDFPLQATATVDSLREQAGAACVALLEDFLAAIERDVDPFEPCGAEWGSRLHTRSMLEAHLLPEKVARSM